MFTLALTEKEKQKKAAADAVKRLGASYYSLTPAQKEAEIEASYQLLFVPQETITVKETAHVDNSEQGSKSQEAPKVHEESVLDIQNNGTRTKDNPQTAVQEPASKDEAEKDGTAFAVAARAILDQSTQATELHPSIQPVKHQAFSLTVKLNAQQQLAADFAENGKCFVLTGAAGTGKTTAGREIAKRLLLSGRLSEHTFRVRETGARVVAPSVAFCAYTNRAANNLRAAIHRDAELAEALPVNITTIHNLLEFAPVFYEIEDEQGNIKKTMRFEPQRHAGKPLDVTHIVIEEASQVGALDLYRQLYAALRPGTQIIFMGDINQLQPIFSPSILNYALITLPVVQLTEVYRQALDSPIIANAHRCLRGEKLVNAAPHFRIVDGNALTKIPTQAACSSRLINSLSKWYDTIDKDGNRVYDPEQDMVLSPWNKQEAGTDHLNALIAQFLGDKRKAEVWEVIAGMHKHYLAVGDLVMVSKQMGTITSIRRNGLYVGKMARTESVNMTRFGVYLPGSEEHKQGDDGELEITGYENIDVDKIPDKDDDPKKNQATHVVTVALENGGEDTLSTAGDFGPTNFSLGYALTVHKAQGCEWRKVFIMLHRGHAVSLTRELVYTAITRAREYCTIIDLSNIIDKAIAAQKIKGNTIEEKIEYFNSSVSTQEPVAIIP